MRNEVIKIGKYFRIDEDANDQQSCEGKDYSWSNPNGLPPFLSLRRSFLSLIF